MVEAQVLCKLTCNFENQEKSNFRDDQRLVVLIVRHLREANRGLIVIGSTIFWVPQFLVGLTSILEAFYLFVKELYG